MASHRYFQMGLCTILKTTDGGGHWLVQDPGSSTTLYSVCFPHENNTGYAVGWDGTILKTTDGGASFVEDHSAVRPLDGLMVERLKATPNPFVSFSSVLGHERERFNLYDISGRRVGTYRGDRIGWNVSPGVYFLRPYPLPSTPDTRILRIVKLR